MICPPSCSVLPLNSPLLSSPFHPAGMFSESLLAHEYSNHVPLFLNSPSVHVRKKVLTADNCVMRTSSLVVYLFKTMRYPLNNALSSKGGVSFFVFSLWTESKERQLRWLICWTVNNGTPCMISGHPFSHLFPFSEQLPSCHMINCETILYNLTWL